MTLDPDCGSVYLETILSCLSMFCPKHFPSCPLLLPSCLEVLVSLWSESVTLQHRQAGKCIGQAGFILPIHSLLVMPSVSINGELACGIHHLDF